MSFKGSRDYLHGTDMFNAICRELPADTISSPKAPLKLAIHRVAQTQCDLLLLDSGEQAAKPASLVAEFAFKSSGKDIIGWLVETGRAVEGRYPYDEKTIEGLCVIEGESIEIKGESGFTPIEVAVCMTKTLHYRLYPIAQGKWVFTKLELIRSFDAKDAALFRIEAKHNLNNRLTKSSILVNGDAVGNIYFSVKQ